MNNLLQKWFPKILQEKQLQKSITPQTIELLQRDLNHCFTQEHIFQMREVLRLCYEDFEQEELYNFLFEINYRKRLINWVDKNLPFNRYEIHDIRAAFHNTNSYMVCDAIRLHLQRCKPYYKKQYSGMRAVESMEVFDFMWYNKKTQIKNQANVQQN